MALDSNQLCLECGLCCNGVIFADGQLQPGDDADHLRTLGLAVIRNRHGKAGNEKFKQPCAKFDGCCRIYSERPKYCRQFECLLLQSVTAGKTELPAAQRIVRTARRRAEKVKRLLRELGDTDERSAVSVRFRRAQKRFETESPSEQTADIYGQLTLAIHDLHVLLSDAFYPG